jgi:hypothetical protein
MLRLLRCYRSIVFLVALLPAAQACAQAIGVVTVMQGEMRVIRGDDSIQAPAGMSVEQGDILSVADDAFAVLEFDDGAVLGLAKGARLFVYLHDSGKGAKAGVQLYLMRGWAKAQLQDRPYAVATDGLVVAATGASFVVRGDEARNDVFVEAGQVEVQQIVRGRPAARVSGARGQFVVQQSGKVPAMVGRPDAEFLAGLPRPFRDPLPRLAQRFAGKTVKPGKLRPVEYAEIADWMRLGSPWSRGMTRRFRGRLRDAEFRRAVRPDVGRYRDWDRVLNPEKYRKPDETPPEGKSPESSTTYRRSSAP